MTYTKTLKARQENLFFVIQGGHYHAIDETIEKAMNRFRRLCTVRKNLVISIYLIKKGFTFEDCKIEVDLFNITYDCPECILLTQTSI